MRIFLAIVILIMVQQVAVHAQSSINFSVGYSLPMGARLLGYETTYTSSPSGNALRQKGIYGSFGAGLNFNASYTLSFSKNFGLDLGASYFSGTSYTSTTTSTSYANTSTPTLKSTLEDHGSMSGWLVSPQLILKTELIKNLQPYAKFGFVLGFVSLTRVFTITDQSTAPVSTTTTNQTSEYTGGLPFGLKGGVGVIFNVNKKTSFFTELVGTNMTYYPDKADITAYSVNGVNQLNLLTVSQKSVVFKNEIYISSTTTPDPTKPSEAQSSSYPMGNILLNIGVHITLGKS